MDQEQSTKIKEDDRASVAELLKRNLEYSEKIYESVNKINRHFFWQKIVSAIYLVLILAPIALALIYLPAYLGKFLQNSLNPAAGGNSIFDQLGDSGGLKNILQQIEKK
jgi:hypothetical protein